MMIRTRENMIVSSRLQLLTIRAGKRNTISVPITERQSFTSSLNECSRHRTANTTASVGDSMKGWLPISKTAQ